MEEKEFIIPKNTKAEFEIMQNVSLKDLLVFVPSVLIDVPLILFVPVSPVFKIVFTAATLFIPLFLVFIRPIRENIPAWKHIVWKFKYVNSQKKFYYRKEEYDHAINQKESEERAIDSAKSNSVKSSRFRVIINARQQASAGLEGKRIESGSNEQSGIKKTI